MIKKILFLSANPMGTDRLSLDKEVREVEAGLRRAKLRDQFEIRSIWAVRFWDLRRALLEFEPHIVHFSGHGGEDGLIVEDERGIVEPISSKALSGLFKLCSTHVECVILNACYSESQADAINKHINYVICMQKEINDKAAFEFSVGIYDALGAGKSVEEAFEFGCNAVLQKCPDPQEHLIPVLKKRKGKIRKPKGTQKRTDDHSPGEHSIPGKPKRLFKRKMTAALLILGAVLLSFLVFLSGIIGSNGEKTDEKINQLGKSIAYSLERELAGFEDSDWEKYKIPEKKLSLLFLYNRGPDIHLGDLLDPLKRHVYELIVKAVDEAVDDSPFLQARIKLLNIDFDQIENMKEKNWITPKERSQIGLKEKENAIYEILLSVDRVKKKIYMGGKLLIGGGEGIAPDEMAFIRWRDIPAADLIEKKYKVPGDRLRKLETITNRAKKLGRNADLIIMASPEKDASYLWQFAIISNGDTVLKNRPLYFKFKMPEKTRYLIILIKDGSGNIENLIPGTTNAVTNGDYFISGNPGTHYTKILQEYIAFDENNKEVKTGAFSPESEGQYTFYFFFLNERNREIEDIAKLVDSPGGPDVEIKDTKGSLVKCGKPIDENSNLESVYSHKVVLNVIEPIGRNKDQW
jgi:hypothetical protein